MRDKSYQIITARRGAERALSENTKRASGRAARYDSALKRKKERTERKTIPFPERAILSPTNGM